MPRVGADGGVILLTPPPPQKKTEYRPIPSCAAKRKGAARLGQPEFFLYLGIENGIVGGGCNIFIILW